MKEALTGQGASTSREEVAVIGDEGDGDKSGLSTGDDGDGGVGGEKDGGTGNDVDPDSMEGGGDDGGTGGNGGEVVGLAGSAGDVHSGAQDSNIDLVADIEVLETEQPVPTSEEHLVEQVSSYK